MQETSTADRRPRFLLASLFLILVIAAIAIRSQPAGNTADDLIVDTRAAYEGSSQVDGIVSISTYPDIDGDEAIEPTVDDGEVPENERLVVPITDETGKMVRHPECAARLRQALGSDSGQLSIGELSDRFHLEHHKDVEVFLGYSDPQTQKSKVVPFTVEDMKYALGHGVVEIRPEEGIRTAEVGDHDLFLFSNNIGILADMRVCRVVGFFLPKPDGEYHDRIQSLNAQDALRVASDKKCKKCTPKKFKKCVRGNAVCGRSDKCPRGWAQRGEFVTGCGRKSPDEQFSQLCIPSPSVPRGVKYLGCRLDGPERIVADKKIVDNRLTFQRCMNHCKHFKYFALEYGKECFCGDKLNGNKYSSKCTMRCKGNGREYCGGPYGAMVFVKPAFRPSPIKGFISVGCLSPTTSTPVLKFFAGESNKMTYRQCWQRCANKKSSYNYFGVHDGKKCYCGDRLQRNRRESAGKCSTNCFGSPNQKCGGPCSPGSSNGPTTVFKRIVADPQLLLARMYGPLLSFNRGRQTNYPMNPQIYYDKYFVGKQRVKVKKTLGGFCKYSNVIEQKSFNPSRMFTYYAISNCQGRTSIKYNWFYGFQYPCEKISCQGAHDQDWEGITVVLNNNEEGIQRVIYSQHGGHYTRFPHGFPRSGQHAKVYVGYSSHGSYHRGTIPGQHRWHRCQYFGDCLAGRNPRLWQTWRSRMYNLPAKKQKWMLPESKKIASGIFTNRYGQTDVEWQDCGGKSCDDTGCQQNQCGIKKDCAPCTKGNQIAQCHGWGLGPHSVWCCSGTCQKRKWWKCP